MSRDIHVTLDNVAIIKRIDLTEQKKDALMQACKLIDEMGQQCAREKQ